MKKLEEKMKDIVNKYRNISYKHNGRSLTGLDCLGLMIFIYKDFGIEVSIDDHEYISKDWYKKDPERYLKGLLQLGRSVEFDQLQVLDLVYFRMMDGIVTHSGVMINDSDFIHVLQKRDVEVASFNRFWTQKFAGARRLI